MGKRPRIQRKKDIGTLVSDELEYKQNLGSKNARLHKTVPEKINFELWYDKHYELRELHGDDEGKREGIDKTAVERLVEKILSHLLYYSSTIKSFSFLNDRQQPAIRTILKDSYSQDQVLTIVAQIHFINLWAYQVTIVTARCGEDFRISSGQYFVELTAENSSTLFRLDNGKITTVASCEG